MSFIEISSLTKNYYNGSIVTQVLKGISFTLNDGDFTALAGPSGSGKTTLLNLIGCLDTCTDGSIIINNMDVSILNKSKRCTFRREHLGFVFQSYNLIPVLTAYENVEYPLILLKVSQKDRKKLVEDILEKVGLQDKMHSYPRQLSGGQQQRVSIARALVSKPELILADEPTANLDSKTGNDIIQLIKKINQTLGTTFLFSTHDRRIMQHANKVIYLNDGMIDQTPFEL